MTLREFPGAIALGLLASLVAHAALFGGAHAMGGPYHAVLLQVAVVACVGFLGGFGALAWAGAARAADGSILAARLGCRLPGLAPLAIATAGWFELAERIEPHHAAGAPLLIVLSLCAAAWLLLAVARGVVRMLAGAIIAVSRSPFSPRVPVWSRLARFVPVARRSPLLRRRFARPPPIAIACA